MKIKIVSTSDVHGYIYPTNFTYNLILPFSIIKNKVKTLKK